MAWVHTTYWLLLITNYNSIDSWSIVAPKDVLVTLPWSHRRVPTRPVPRNVILVRVCVRASRWFCAMLVRVRARCTTVADRWRNVVQSIAVGRRATCAIVLCSYNILYTTLVYYFIFRPNMCKTTTPAAFDLSLCQSSDIPHTQSAAPGSSTRSFVRFRTRQRVPAQFWPPSITHSLPANHFVPAIITIHNHSCCCGGGVSLLPVPRPLKLPRGKT